MLCRTLYFVLLAITIKTGSTRLLKTLLLQSLDDRMILRVGQSEGDYVPQYLSSISSTRGERRTKVCFRKYTNLTLFG